MVKYMLPLPLPIQIREYLDRADRSPFRIWLRQLNADAARKVTTSLYRLSLGNFSSVKGVGSSIFECKIDFGPGYRIYFGKDGDTIVILLAGGTKHSQSKDILNAQDRWQDYKLRKRSKP
jgi:putative addiction module killer protein